MELAAARQEGFVPKHLSGNYGKHSPKRLLSVIGIITTFGRKKSRDAMRKAWMPTVPIVDVETVSTGKLKLKADNQVEAPEECDQKIKPFFIYAVDKWDAKFYVKVNDDVYISLDAIGAVLTSRLDNPRVYIGCMKSGKVYSELYILRPYAHDDVNGGLWFIGRA